MTTVAQNRPVLRGRQIRLVRIYRSYAKRPESSFTVINLDDIPHLYMATSYVWGDPEIVDRRPCNEGYDLPLTASAQRLVERISRMPPQYFWIDSLCINEKDPRENSGQLALIATIFRSAGHIIAWSGWELGFPFRD